MVFDITFNVVAPKKFNEYLIKNNRLEFLTICPESDMKTWKLLLTGTKDGGAGFAITPEKELVNLFNNTGIKGLGRAIIRCAISLGATKVFCLDGFLRKYYESFGFKVYKRMPWNPKYAPKNWDYRKYGKPDVVWLKR